MPPAPSCTPLPSPHLMAYHQQAGVDWIGRNTEGGASNLLCQKCPTCHVLVGRSDGCSHMDCVCGESFCYDCAVLAVRLNSYARGCCWIPLLLWLETCMHRAPIPYHASRGPLLCLPFYFTAARKVRRESGHFQSTGVLTIRSVTTPTVNS
jgi:hypothetical protein